MKEDFMTEYKIYLQSEFPAVFKWQGLAFMRLEAGKADC